MELTTQQHIDAPIEQVFHHIADADKRHAWMAGTGKAIFDDGYNPANPVGAKFKMFIREGGRDVAYEGEIVAYESPTYFVFELGRNSYRALLEYQLKAAASGGTDITHQAAIVTDKWWIRLIGRVFSGMTRAIMAKQMSQLKACVEKDADSPSDADTH